MHPVDRFRRALAAIPLGDYPSCLSPVDRATLEEAAGGAVGVAAFPLSHGLYAPPGWDHRVLPGFPAPGQGVMVVGNHPDAEEAAKTRLRDKGAHGDPTPGAATMTYWRELYRLFDDADIDRSLLFATNIHPAFHATTNGKVPRRGNERWFAHARYLLETQIRTMQPRLLLMLGGPARAELERLSIGIPRLQLNEPLVASVRGHAMAVLCARHPSAPGTTLDLRAQRTAALRAAWGLASQALPT